MLLPSVPAATSLLDSDKIIGTLEGSMSVSSTSPSVTLDSNNVNLPFCYFYGVYSIDGGDTWLDFNMYHVIAGKVQDAIQLPLIISGYFETDPPTSPEGTFILNAFNATGKAYTLLYKVWFIAKDDIGAIDIGSNKYVSAIQSGFNYPKVAYRDVHPMTISALSTGNYTFNFTEELDDVPMISCFVEQEGYRFRQAGDLINAFSHVKVYDDSVVWRIDNSGNPNSESVILHTIVYYD